MVDRREAVSQFFPSHLSLPKSTAIIHIPFYKRLFSYFYPLVLRRATGDINTHLELLLYHNRFQLATADALYSDGSSYIPAIAAVKALRDSLPSVKKVLVLGTGLGSLMQVMRAYGYAPRYTLVEQDKTVLGWALELMDKEQAALATPVCSDAQAYMAQNHAQYDLVFIDIFIGMVVPDFVTQADFLQRCKMSIAPGGHVAFNYIAKSSREWERVKETFGEVFPGYSVVEKGVNRILIAQHKPSQATKEA